VETFPEQESGELLMRFQEAVDFLHHAAGGAHADAERHMVAAEFDGAGLVGEVERYLAAVDAFRAAGQEPRWLPETTPPRTPAGGRRTRRITTPKGDST